MIIEVRCPICDKKLAEVSTDKELSEQDIQNVKDSYLCSDCITEQEQQVPE